MAAPTPEEIAAAYAMIRDREKAALLELASIVEEFKTSFSSVLEGLPDGAVNSVLGGYIGRLQQTTAFVFNDDLKNIKAAYGLE